MALDERYIVASDLEQYFVDKDTGEPLAGGTLTFYRDIARNVPKVVYQLSGSPPNYTYTAMPNPITLSSVGTVQNAGGDNEVIYYFPYTTDPVSGEEILDLYYIVVRNSDGIEQFTREAWPNITSANDPTRDQLPVQNQIANPQFTRNFLSPGLSTTFTVSAATNQVFEFAPDWDFVISGTGTVVIQVVAIAGNENVATSPPYVLDINVSSGITACYLRQRMNVNSGLWASTLASPIFLATTLIARNENVGTAGVQMFYAESSGGTPITILDASFDNSGYQVKTGSSTAAIPLSSNTDTGQDGYIDIYLSMTASSHIRVSSIQVVPTLSDAGADFIQYDIQSANREQALMGDYYIPRLEAKAIPSLLTGWDFTVNPFQFGLSGNIGATGSYICDQTIAARGSSGNVAFAVSSVTNALQLTTAGTNDAFYILQYLTGDQAKKMIGTRLSANVFAYKGSVGSDVTMRIYLFRATAAATIPALGSTIVTLSSSGEVTLTAAGWTQIPRSGLATPQVTLNTVATNPDVNSPDNDYGFSGWEITDSSQIADTDKFAIIVSFAYVTASTVITVNSVGLVPGDIPCRPGVQSIAQCLVDCQYYYESSYPPGIAAGSVASAGITVEQGADHSGGTARGYGTAFGMFFNSVKRANPTLHLYAPGTGTIDTATMNVYTGGAVRGSANIASTSWTFSAGQRSFGAIANTAADLVTGVTATATRPFSDLFFNFSADARLGIV